MTKNEIIAIVSEKINITKNQCEQVIDCFIDELTNCLVNNDKLVIKNFASIYVSELSPRKARNPVTGKIVTNPATRIVKCKISPTIKNAVNRKRD